MKTFTYTRASTVAEAAKRATPAGAMPITGGTNLLDLAKPELINPDQIIDITRLPDLNTVTRTSDGTVHIGALVTNADLAAHPLIRQHYPVLSRAILSGASPQIRNMATTGGNLLQRTRCIPFYDPAARCNKRTPGAGCDALHGPNRMNAILGGSPACIAVNPSDMAVALRVLDATIHVTTAAGTTRTIPIADFHLLPGNTPDHETRLERGDIITGLTLPPPPPGRQVYRKVRDRASYAFALVSVAAIIDADPTPDASPHIRSARFALGGIATKPWRIPAAEAALADQPLTRDALNRAADLTLAGASGHGENDFKIPLARRTLTHVIAHTARNPIPMDPSGAT